MEQELVIEALKVMKAYSDYHTRNGVLMYARLFDISIEALRRMRMESYSIDRLELWLLDKIELFNGVLARDKVEKISNDYRRGYTDALKEVGRMIGELDDK